MSPELSVAASEVMLRWRFLYLMTKRERGTMSGEVAQAFRAYVPWQMHGKRCLIS